MSINDKEDSIRTLEEICDSLDQSFGISLYGNKYCRLGISKKIKCGRQSKNKDHNGNYPCLKGTKNYKDIKDF